MPEGFTRERRENPYEAPRIDAVQRTMDEIAFQECGGFRCVL